jgi:enoyl-CoA hydratase/carnithine racemase
MGSDHGFPSVASAPDPREDEAMTAYSDIDLEIDDPGAVIRLTRPDKLNAFTYHTLGEIRRAVDACVADQRVVGIVITGAGRGFCAGLDAATLAEVTGRGAPPAATNPDSGELPGIFSYLLEVPKPVIAAVNGVAAGGGLILALMCDLRLASRDASFVTVFLKRGLVAEHGSSWLLPRLVGVSRALDLLWTSDRIDAVEQMMY